MKLGRSAPAGCTPGGIGGAPEVIFGRVKVSRSAATERRWRPRTVPPTPLRAPKPRSPNVCSERRRSVSGTAESGSPPEPAGARVRRRSAAIPQSVPSTVGMRSATLLPGWLSTASDPARPPAASARVPSGIRARSQIAATAMSALMTTTTMTVRNVLSLVPKVWMAHSLTGPGVRLITEVPTAVRASAAGENTTAASCVTPRATAAAARPADIRAPMWVCDISTNYRRGEAFGVHRSAGPPGDTHPSPFRHAHRPDTPITQHPPRSNPGPMCASATPRSRTRRHRRMQ